jgi:hypothetical protein
MAAPQALSAAAIGNLAKVLVGGGLAVYGATHSIFNVEGGHRAIVFNRLVGIKDTVRRAVLPIAVLLPFRLWVCARVRRRRAWARRDVVQHGHATRSRRRGWALARRRERAASRTHTQRRTHTTAALSLSLPLVVGSPPCGSSLL